MYHPTEVKNNWNTYSLCKAVTISGLASPCSNMDIVFFRWFEILKKAQFSPDPQAVKQKQC